ncbi:MAG: protein-disulfide reductase DsbD [Methylorubrum populi]
MPNLLAHLILAALVWAGASLWSPGHCQEAAARRVPFTLAATRQPDLSLHLRWTIPAGTYLYRDRIAASAPTGQSLPVAIGPGETEDDPNFGPTEVYHGAAEATVPGAALAGLRSVRVTYQGCAEKGICYPPVTQTLDLAAPGAPEAARPDGGSGTKPAVGDVAGGPREAARSGILPSGPASLLTGNLAGVLMGMFGLGVLLAFTPCVLPMVPILSGMLVRTGGGLTPVRGFVLSGSYVLAMAGAYASLGLAAAWLGRNLQVALQTPLALGLMALTLVALALSMFGLFDVQAPRWWRDRTAGSAAAGGGSVLAAALLGFSSALIVGPCVTPPLAAALLYVAQTGDVLRGALALFALGLGMGAPLVAFGTFGAGVLPRSGPWLVRAKQAFGFVFLALAVSLVARLLPGGLTLLLWGVLAIGLGWSVAALAGAGGRARLGKAAGIAVAAYGCALLVGAATGGSDPLRPLSGLVPGAAAPLAHRTATTPGGLDAALREARERGAPVLVEFAADWCSVCKTNERTVLADPEIRERLKAVSVIRADVTHDAAGTRALMQRYEVVGPPTLIFLRADGSEVRDARTEGELAVGELKRRLALIGA